MSEEWYAVGQRVAIMQPSRSYANEFNGYTTVVRLTPTQIVTKRYAADYEQKWRRKDLVEVNTGKDNWRKFKLAPMSDPRVWRALYYKEILEITTKVRGVMDDTRFLGHSVPTLMKQMEALCSAAGEAHEKLAKIYAQEQDRSAS